MKQNRREFLKVSVMSVTAMGLLSKVAGLFQNAIANAFPDVASLGKQGYIRNVFKADQKTLDGIPKYKAHKTDKMTPMCLNCKQYKTPAGGWGNCAMVGALGPKKVCELGLCKVYTIDPTKADAKPTLDIEKTV